MIKNFNVGPSELFPGVKEFLSDAIQSDKIIMPHRSAEFSELYKQTEHNFKIFFKIPENYKVFFTHSATDSMDIVINALESEKLTHITNGVFGDLFINSSHSAQKNVTIKSGMNQVRFDLGSIESMQDVLIVTANDTSTGMNYTNEELEELRNKNVDAQIIVDATSSFGALKYDISLADAWILSVQKNLGLPSGLGIMIVNQNLIDEVKIKEKTGKYIGGHNSLLKLDNFYEKFHTPATPNTLLISGVGCISQLYLEEFGSIENLDQYTKDKAEYFYSEIEKIEGLEIYNRGEGKSFTTFVVSITEEKLLEVNNKCKENGYSFSPGLYDLSGKVIRIANFPVHTREDFEELIKLLQ